MKYITDVSGRLQLQLDGVNKNPDILQNQLITKEMIEAKIGELTAKKKAIDDKNTETAVLQKEAHALSAEGTELADRVESLLRGILGNSPDKLIVYGIQNRKTQAKKPACTEILQITLADDTDGVGFIVTTRTEKNADMYEWQKGQSADASKTDQIPEMKHFKITIKTTFVDDDVVKGVRYFYRVRAVNAAGEGPWSEAVSRVQ